MKITPIEIRQKEFEKGFRGYDKDEVKAFLSSLSHEWERINDEHKELRFKLEAAEKEVAKLREVESSLYKTLKTAEDTGANVVEQANKTAELHIREAQMKAEALLNEAKQRAEAIIEEAGMKAKEIAEDMADEVREMSESYKTLENHRDNLLSDLRHLADDMLEKVGKMKDKKQAVEVDSHLKKAKALVRKTQNETEIQQEALQKEAPEMTDIQEIKPEKATKPKKEGKDDNVSFFDELE